MFHLFSKTTTMVQNYNHCRYCRYLPTLPVHANEPTIIEPKLHRQPRDFVWLIICQKCLNLCDYQFIVCWMLSLHARGCALIFLEDLLVIFASKVRKFEFWADPGKNPNDHCSLLMIQLHRESRMQSFIDESNAIDLVT